MPGVASGYTGPPLVWSAAANAAQPNVPLMKIVAVSLTRNSSSAPSWPARSDAPPPSAFCSQSEYRRVVGLASMLLTVIKLPR